MIDLSVIIVSWNTCDLLRQCLRTVIAESSSLEFEIVVVDNASTDGTLAMLASEFPKANMIANTENVGFAAANNQGLEHTTGRYRLLLNPDTEVINGALGQMVEYLDSHPTTGALGPKLILPDQTIQGGAAGHFPSPRTLFDYAFGLHAVFPAKARPLWLDANSYRAPVVEVDWVSGACLTLRDAVLDQVGPLDTTYFMYGEDIEWCYRMKQAGWGIICLSSATVVHHIGGSAVQRGEGFVSQHVKGLDTYYRSQHRGLKVALMHFWGMCGFALRAAFYHLLASKKSRTEYTGSPARTMWYMARTSLRCLTGQPNF